VCPLQVAGHALHRQPHAERPARCHTPTISIFGGPVARTTRAGAIAPSGRGPHPPLAGCTGFPTIAAIVLTRRSGPVSADITGCYQIAGGRYQIAAPDSRLSVAKDVGPLPSVRPVRPSCQCSRPKIDRELSILREARAVVAPARAYGVHARPIVRRNHDRVRSTGRKSIERSCGPPWMTTETLIVCHSNRPAQVTAYEVGRLVCHRTPFPAVATVRPRDHNGGRGRGSDRRHNARRGCFRVRLLLAATHGPRASTQVARRDPHTTRNNRK
jgi:hypothetical protein